jgi:hypothetical protein
MRAICIAPLLSLLLAGAAQAETMVIACQSDKVTEKGASKVVSDSEKKLGVWLFTFAYDLTTGKACSIDHKYQVCATNHEVKPGENGALVLTSMLRDRRTDTTLITPTGRFNRISGDYVWSGGEKTCSPVADLAIDLNQRPDPWS